MKVDREGAKDTKRSRTPGKPGKQSKQSKRRKVAVGSGASGAETVARLSQEFKNCNWLERKIQEEKLKIIQAQNKW